MCALVTGVQTCALPICVLQACSAALMQGIQQTGLGVPHQRVWAIIELFAQLVEGLVQGTGFVRINAIQRGRRAFEIGRVLRSEARRVGNECVSTWRSRW